MHILLDLSCCFCYLPLTLKKYGMLVISKINFELVFVHMPTEHVVTQQLNKSSLVSYLAPDLAIVERAQFFI